MVGLAGVLVGGGARGLTAELPPLTPIVDVRAQVAAGHTNGATVRVSGYVTFCSPVDPCLFLQDSTGGIYVGLTNLAEWFEVGERLEAWGVPGWSDHGITLAGASVELVSDGEGASPPVPRPVSLGELSEPRWSGAWVEVTGVVRSVREAPMRGSEAGGDHLASGNPRARRFYYELGDGTNSVLAVVDNVPQPLAEATGRIDAEVRVSGVALEFRFEGRVQPLLLVQSPELFRVVSPPPEPSTVQPLVPLGQLAQIESTPHRVRVRAQVQSVEPGGDLILVRDQRTVRATVIAAPPGLGAGDWVDAVGFPGGDEAGVSLVSAEVLLLGTMGPVASSPWVGVIAPDTLVPALTRARDVRLLSPDEADRGHPVRLRGVLTYYNATARNAFLQDETDGIYLGAPTAEAAIAPGTLVEVRGVSGAGDFAPIVWDARLAPLEVAGFPAPPEFSAIEPLLSGLYDSVWIQVEGVVWSVRLAPADSGHLVLGLGVNGRRFDVWVPWHQGGELPLDLVNARVRARGVCATDYNASRQLQGVFMNTPSLEFVQRLGGSGAPAATDAIAIGTIKTFKPRRDTGHRVEIEGTVTYQSRDGLLAVADGSGAVFVRPRSTEGAAVGQRVRVAGFVALVEQQVELVEAECTPVAGGVSVAPRASTAAEVILENLNAALVTLEGEVQHSLLAAGRPEIEVSSGDYRFRALLDGVAPTATLPTVRAGGRVRLTGVARVELSANPAEAGSLSLLLRAPLDMVVLDAGPWLTRARSRQLSWLVGSVLLAGVGWVMALRRQVRRQSAAIRIQMRQEAALQERYRLVWENSREGMRLSDEDGAVVRVNQAYCQLVGRPREALEGRPFTEILDPEVAGAAREAYATLFREGGGAPRESRLTLWDGRVLWLEITTSRFQPDEGRPLLLALYRDIAARKRAATRLERLNKCLLGFGGDAEANIARVVAFCGEELGADGVVYQRLRGTHLCSAACWRLPQGFHCADPPAGTLCHPEVAEHAAGSTVIRCSEAKASGSPLQPPAGFRQCAAHAVRFDGRLVGHVCALLCEERAVASEDLHLLGIVASAISVEEERLHATQERLEVERRMLDAQKLESLGVLAGGIAHDFNNLLTTILGNAGLVAEDLPANSPLQDGLTEIRTTARQAADLCRQMLAYSGRGRFELQTLDANRVLAEMRQLLQVTVSKTASFELALGPEAPNVRADAMQLRQVIMNLVANASEAMGDQAGRVVVRTGLRRVASPLPLASPALAPLSPGDYLVIEVQDSGSGMAAEVRERMFEPFFSTRFAGRGLGLPAVLGIVRGHQGGLLVESSPGTGTTVSVLLPVALPEVAEPPAIRTGSGVWAGGGTVLLADDEEAVRRVLGRGLERLGCEVLVAADGTEAMALFAENADRLTLAVLDLTMPGMSGTALCRAIKEQRRELPVLLISGYGEEEATKRFGDAGPDGFLQKPFQLEELRRKLAQVADLGDTPARPG